MELTPQPLIADVQRMDGGVFITFGDGQSVFYSPALLYKTISQAHVFVVPLDEDED